MKAHSPIYSSPEFQRHLYLVSKQEEAFDQDDGLGCMRGTFSAVLFVVVCLVVFFVAAWMVRGFQ